jgi:penicillin-binding protein 1A
MPAVFRAPLLHPQRPEPPKKGKKDDKKGNGGGGNKGGGKGGDGQGGGGKAPPPRKNPVASLFYLAVTVFVWTLIAGGVFLAIFASDLPDVAKVWDMPAQNAISYYDRDGHLIASRGSQYAAPARLSDLPKYVPAAVVAVEDRRFYQHIGIDPFGLGRATVVNLRAGRVVQGGSTLTQQLAKNLFLTNNRTFKRKAQELILAVLLEAKFSKDQILTLYLNRVYFGAGAWGIEAAAQRYFHKPASKLTLGEAAMLAGLLKGPSKFSPIKDTGRAEDRATIVLDLMVETKAITPKERDAAFDIPIRVASDAFTGSSQYFVDWIDPEVRRLVGDVDEDLIVETTLDLGQQLAAEQAMDEVLNPVAKERKIGQAAVLAMEGTGEVRAMVGGRSYSDSQFNRVSQAKRQPGSSFKPFVYLAALEKGLTPADVRVDGPVSFGDWRPQNYTGEYLGPVTLEVALSKSINTVAAQLAEEVGSGAVARVARRLGITTRIGTARSVALGAVEVSPLELATAYVPFANGGYRTAPWGIMSIRTADGHVLYEHKAEERFQVIATEQLGQMNRMLRKVVTAGTGTGARMNDPENAGKTGTTSDYRDAWFIGYVGDYVTAVWMGNDDNSQMRKVTGGSLPATIWQTYMGRIRRDLPKKPLVMGGDVVQGDPLGALAAGSETPTGTAVAPEAEPQTAPPEPVTTP